MKNAIHYVGLDVHKDSIAVALCDQEGRSTSLGTIPNGPDPVARLMRRLQQKASLRVCYEAGCCGYVLRRQLTAMGIDCIVVAPSLIPVKSGDRVKTDRRDALKLARYLRAGELTAVWVPDETHEALRDLVRLREDAKADQKRARNRLGKFLLRQGWYPRLAQLGPKVALWVQDETVLRLFPPLRKSWARRGQQAAVDIHGRNQKLVLFGGLNLRTGQLLLLPRRRQTAADFAQWLLLLRNHSGPGPLCVLLDENACHKAKDSGLQAAALGIELISQPKRSPHLNPADHRCRWVKQSICSNRQDQTVEALMRAVISSLLELSPQESLRKAGVLSSEFWLRGVL